MRASAESGAAQALFSEPSIVVGGMVPEVGALRQGVGRDGREKVREGNEGVPHSEAAEALLSVEVSWSRMSPT